MDSASCRSEEGGVTLQEFESGLRALFNIDGHEYLPCINAADRQFFGDNVLWSRFRDDPVKTFVGLPTQDQQRVFEIVARRVGGAS